tara:strand:+ start:62 stop:505 length:444 start_codon:yes stop_codon:yes gene_type:complete
MDIYKRPLSPDEIILLYLKELINHNVDICKFILKIKKKIEKEEIMEWYIARWENIAGAHYILHDTHYEKFSLIYNENDYIVKPDHKLSFYKITGISYQIIELIHELIKLKNKDSIENTFIIDYKEWLQYDDNLYTILSKKITERMNK